MIKDILAHEDNRMAMRFCYEHHDASGDWFYAHSNENWEFDAEGCIASLHPSTIDITISEKDRLRYWSQGRRPPGDGGLSDLGLSMMSATTNRKQVETAFFDLRERVSR